MVEQCDLFEGSYRSLNDILGICERLNLTGGMFPDGRLQSLPISIQFFKDLAFVGVFEGELIHMAVYLHAIDPKCSRFVIYKIDGEIFSCIHNDGLLDLVFNLLNALKNTEIFVKGERDGKN